MALRGTTLALSPVAMERRLDMEYPLDQDHPSSSQWKRSHASWIRSMNHPVRRRSLCIVLGTTINDRKEMYFTELKEERFKCL
jgi:hypothetical protein